MWEHIASQTLASFSLLLMILSILSLWVYRHIWIWGALLVCSYILGYYGNLVTYKSIFPIVALLICHFTISLDTKRFTRFLAATVAAVVSFAMLTGLVKGFDPITLMDNVKLSADSYPYSFRVGLSKAFVGIFILGLCLPLIKTRSEWKKMLTVSIPWSVLTILILMGISATMGLTRYSIKWPPGFLFWIPINLFLTVVPEEAFFRGFLQKEITKNLPNAASGILAILVVSILFALFHLFFVPTYAFVVIAFVASLLYGGIYYLTENVESAVICHFLVNLVHICFFSYPALIK